MQVRADLEQLDQLAGQLAWLREAIGRGPDLPADPGTLGSARVAAALARCTGNWTMHRAEVVDLVGRAAGYLAGAATGYRDTEAQLARLVWWDGAGTRPG